MYTRASTSRNRSGTGFCIFLITSLLGPVPVYRSVGWSGRKSFVIASNKRGNGRTVARGDGGKGERRSAMKLGILFGRKSICSRWKVCRYRCASGDGSDVSNRHSENKFRWESGGRWRKAREFDLVPGERHAEAILFTSDRVYERRARSRVLSSVRKLEAAPLSTTAKLGLAK